MIPEVKPLKSEVGPGGIGPTRWEKCNSHDLEFIQTWIDHLEIWTGSCPSCAEEDRTGKRVPRRGQTAEDLRLELSGIPERFRGKTLKDFPHKSFKHAVDIGRNFSPVNGDNLLIVGPIATGKTSFVAALLAEQLTSPEWPEGALGHYAGTREVMESLWAASQPRSWADGAYIELLVDEVKRLNGYHLLILDDMDIHAPGELEWLERILAKRLSEKRSTVIIGGPDLETLCAVLGPRILDRLRGWKQISFESGGDK